MRASHFFGPRHALTTDDGQAEASVEPIGSSQIKHPADDAPMVKVDASVFLSGPSNEPVWLDDFYIDVHPVTNAEYALFIAATGHTAPEHWNDGKLPEELADHPVVFRDVVGRGSVRRMGR